MAKIKSPNKQDNSKIKPRENKKVSTNTFTPIFSFEHMIDKCHCVDCCENDDLVALVKRIRLLSKMTWNQILSSSRHKLGCEKIARDSINEKIPTKLHGQEDINFLSLRFNGMKPMIGFREDRIFHIIWIDFDFKVYKHE